MYIGQLIANKKNLLNTFCNIKNKHAQLNPKKTFADKYFKIKNINTPNKFKNNFESKFEILYNNIECWEHFLSFTPLSIYKLNKISDHQARLSIKPFSLAPVMFEEFKIVFKNPYTGKITLEKIVTDRKNDSSLYCTTTFNNKNIKELNLTSELIDLEVQNTIRSFNSINSLFYKINIYTENKSEISINYKLKTILGNSLNLGNIQYFSP